MARIDLTVRGAGIFGLSIGWEAQMRGARVRLVDPGGPGAGASGGVLGALAPHVPETWNAKKAFQFDSLLAAEPFWRGVEAVSGLPSGYGRTGRLQPLADASAVSLARSREESAAALWQGAAVWEVVEEAGAGGEWAPASASGYLVKDTLSARLHPRKACESLATALRMKGAEIVAEAEDEGPVVWATGTEGLRALSEALGRPVGVGVKGQAALLHFSAPDQPQVFADGLHIVPHDDGTVAVGSTTERDYDDPRAPDGQLDALVERAADVLPVLRGARIVARWAGERPRAASRAPVLGPWPGRAGHFVANGGFKTGFGMAPGVASVMADLVLDGRDGVPEGFRVEDCLGRTTP